MTQELFPIDIEGLAPPTVAPTPGFVPMLEWMPISRLVVDRGYQREIGQAGRRNIARIAANFRWSRFSPVVCSPVAGGQLAIIDGQHRVTAARLIGIESVPCQVIIADRAEQADAFQAINAATTRMHICQVFGARLTAGEPQATAIAQACADAGVTILRNPRAASRILERQTNAVGTIEKVFDTYGAGILTLALRCLVETSNNLPGVLGALNVMAVAAAIAGDRALRDLGEAVIRLFDQVDVAEVVDPFRITGNRFDGRVAEAAAAVARAALAATVAAPVEPAAEQSIKPSEASEDRPAPLALPGGEPSSVPGRLDLVEYLGRKNRIVVRSLKGFFIDGAAHTPAEAAAVVNKYRRRAGLPPLTPEEIA